MSHSDEGNHRLHQDVLHAKAIATVLEEEFGVAFNVYDSAAEKLLWPQNSSDTQTLSAPCGGANLPQFVTAERARVISLPRNHYRLTLPISRSVGPALIAEAVLKGLAAPGPNAEAEQARLERWAQTALQRLQQADLLRSRRQAEEDLKAQLKKAWGLNLTLDRLIRHLRVHKEVAANRRQILEAALPFLDAEALVWVPREAGPVMIHGTAALLAQDARSLVSVIGKERELRDSGLLVSNRARETTWGARFPAVKHVMALALPASNPVGWLLAINKHPENPAQSSDHEGSGEGFRRGDAAALAPFAALLCLHVRFGERYQDLKDLLVGLTRSLASSVDAKDPYTYGHSERVARIAVELGRELGLNEDELGDLYLAGLLHDIGKIGIRDQVLGKREPLSAEETEHMQQHPTIGHAILQDLQQIHSLLPGVLCHHERFDGTGYPSGLAGEQIPLLARILSVADSYDAMSTSRPYRNALPPNRVEEILAEGADKQWEGRVIEAFRRCHGRLRLIHERGLGESLRQALDGALRDRLSSLAMPVSIVAEGTAV